MDIVGTIRRNPARWAVAALVAAALVGFGLWWFTPWRLFTDDPVDEALPGAAPVEAGEPVVESEETPTTLARGEFISLEHETAGRALVLETAGGKRFLRFEAFETSNGPDLLVYLSSKEPAGSDDWYGYDQDFVALGPLNGNVGSQNYEIPPDVDLERYSTAVVWCRRFEVGFAAAPLG
jgi:hypothetical protein